MIFFEISFLLRIDESFLIMDDEDYYKGELFLIDVNIGMVLQILIDYMFFVFLGVMKCFLCFWIKGFFFYCLSVCSVL